jgi:phage antirepressor YoqD-like protein
MEGGFVLEKPEQFEDMMWECAKGNISTEDAAKKCGMKLATFYSWLRKDEEAYALFRKNVPNRHKSVMPVDLWRNRMREKELEQKRKAEEVMSKYHAKCKIADKVAQARALGMSYGYYSALIVNGLGRL